MRTLYWLPGTCSLAIHVALEAIGEPYEAVEVARDQLRSPAYLAINPMGVVPSLAEDGRILVEAGAILFHLADSHPDVSLGPPAGDAARADFYRWVCYLTGTVHPHFWPFFMPARYAEVEAAHADVKVMAERRVAGDFDLIEAHLTGRDWLVGDGPGAADAMLLPIARWGMGLGKPTTAWPHLAAHMRRMNEWAPAAAALKAQGLKPL